MQQLVGRGVAVLVAAWVLGAPAPAHADLGDVAGSATGDVSGTAQTVQQTAQQTAQQTVQHVKQQVTQPPSTPDPGPTVAKVAATVTGTAAKAGAPVRQATAPAAPQPSPAPSRQQTSPSRRATPVQPGAGQRVSGPREIGRRHARTGGNAATGGRVRADRGRPRHGSRPARVLASPPTAKMLAVSLVHVPARAAAAPVVPAADARLPRVADGCSTPSLDPAELRRCALASVLGPTGGLPAEIPLAGLLTLAVGAALASRGGGSRGREQLA